MILMFNFAMSLFPVHITEMYNAAVCTPSSFINEQAVLFNYFNCVCE